MIKAMSSLALFALFSAAAHATPACSLFLEASADPATLKGLIARTGLREKISQRLEDHDLTSLGAVDENEMAENERQWNEDSDRRSTARRANYQALLVYPLGRAMLAHEMANRTRVQDRERIIEKTIFHEFGRHDVSYAMLLDLRGRLGVALQRWNKHIVTMKRIVAYQEKAAWWAGGVHLPRATMRNANPVTLGYRARARQLAHRMNRRLSLDVTEVELLIDPSHSAMFEINADEGVSRLSAMRVRMDGIKDQLEVSKSLVDSRILEIVTRVKSLLQSPG